MTTPQIVNFIPRHTRARSSAQPLGDADERGDEAYERRSSVAADAPASLSPEEIAALRRAAQNQLVRWSRHGIKAADQDRREHLRRALHKLKTVKGGCDIRPEPSHSPCQLGFREGAGS